MRVAFDRLEAAAEQLKQLANANGIPAGAAASLVLQAALFSRGHAAQGAVEDGEKPGQGNDRDRGILPLRAKNRQRLMRIAATSSECPAAVP